ncbi:hypothetical protein [Fulvivirga lutimaris]|nr:hypothetical protein [Fulvivirga lutimaris]
MNKTETGYDKFLKAKEAKVIRATFLKQHYLLPFPLVWVNPTNRYFD